MGIFELLKRLPSSLPVPKRLATSFWVQSPQYNMISPESKESDEEEMLSGRRRAWKCGKVHFVYLMLIVTVAVISFRRGPGFELQHLLESQSLYWEEPVRSEIRLNKTPRIFELDLDYAMPPSEIVNKAWSSLIPKKGGFFTHPTISPAKSCFAVFHQIHCLDMLRLALYELHPDTKDQVRNNTRHHSDSSHTEHKGSTIAELNYSYDIYHVGHCFDLLRQAIMCRPDLVGEPSNSNIGSVTGFGAKHQCVSWQQLMDWMVKNE